MVDKYHWQTIPSVTTGGKPSFYLTETNYGKFWVVWDRIAEKWQVHGEQLPPNGECKIYGYFNFSYQAIEYVNKTFGYSELVKEASNGKL
jgi:hypothetical protein